MSNGDFSGYDFRGNCNEFGYIDGGYLMPYTGDVSKMRLSIIAGGMIRLTGPLCARLGAGYGNRTVRWKMQDGNWMRNTAFSFE